MLQHIDVIHLKEDRNAGKNRRFMYNKDLKSQGKLLVTQHPHTQINVMLIVLACVFFLEFEGKGALLPLGWQ